MDCKEMGVKSSQLVTSASVIDEEPENELQVSADPGALPRERNWDGRWMCKYQGFWCSETKLQFILRFQRHFKAHDTDILIATMPKSGTTWLKALVFSVVWRNKFAINQSPLLTSNPHPLVPFLELNIYAESENPNLADIPAPRIFATHVPYKALPRSIKELSKCRIVYISRNPLDQLVSHVHFQLSHRLGNIQPENPVEEAFELFCRGIQVWGPIWDHMLGYWNASLENPDKVLFLKYEDLQEDIVLNVKKIAEFLGMPFTAVEEEQGLVEEIARLCSFEHLKNLEANKQGKTRNFNIPNSSFFRKGQVGDWVNYLTPSMAERVDKLMQENLGESGLSFQMTG